MTTQQQTLTSQDSQFIMRAARVGAAEIKLGQLAVHRGSRDEIKQFGQHMIRDHSEASRELKQLASKKGAQVFEELDPEHTEAMNRLSGLNGPEFDREYLQLMVEDHKKAIDEFEREANQGQDNELKLWAGRTLPILQRHLEMAEDIGRKH